MAPITITFSTDRGVISYSARWSGPYRGSQEASPADSSAVNPVWS